MLYRPSVLKIDIHLCRILQNSELRHTIFVRSFSGCWTIIFSNRVPKYRVSESGEAQIESKARERTGKGSGEGLSEPLSGFDSIIAYCMQ